MDGNTCSEAESANNGGMNIKSKTQKMDFEFPRTTLTIDSVKQIWTDMKDIWVPQNKKKYSIKQEENTHLQEIKTMETN